jgi:hypothetical protein
VVVILAQRVACIDHKRTARLDSVDILRLQRLDDGARPKVGTAYAYHHEKTDLW